MTTQEEHIRIIQELEDDIREKLRRGIIVQKQKIIGFSTSEAATNLFALLLHKKHLISSGFNVNHLFFVSKKKAEERFNFDFPNKNKILSLLVRQENLRGKLCYGRQKNEKVVIQAIKTFYKLKELVEKEIGEVI